jgi:adenine phosphoribosyltransferase
LINRTEKFLKNKIRVIPNFPKKGIMFQDIFSLVEDPKSLNIIVNEISKTVKNNKFTKIAGIEARGFIFGSLVAMKNKIPFIPIRKQGKLPGNTFKKKYKLEYGFDQIEIQKNSILKKDKVLIIDDLIATGGTACASADLIKNMSPKKISFLFVVDLYNLGGAEMLLKKEYDVFTLIKTKG